MGTEFYIAADVLPVELLAYQVSISFSPVFLCMFYFTIRLVMTEARSKCCVLLLIFIVKGNLHQRKKLGFLVAGTLCFGCSLKVVGCPKFSLLSPFCLFIFSL